MNSVDFVNSLKKGKNWTETVQRQYIWRFYLINVTDFGKKKKNGKCIVLTFF